GVTGPVCAGGNCGRRAGFEAGSGLGGAAGRFDGPGLKQPPRLLGVRYGDGRDSDREPVGGQALEVAERRVARDVGSPRPGGGLPTPRPLQRGVEAIAHLLEVGSADFLLAEREVGLITLVLT